MSSPAASASGSASPARSRSIPDLIVADEPCSGARRSIQAQIINCAREPPERSSDLTYLFIAHDLAVVRHIGPDRGHVSGDDRRDLARRGALRQSAPPVHDLAPDGGADSRSHCGKAARADPARRRPAEPREPPVRMPFSHAVPLCAANAVRDRAAGAPQARGRPCRRSATGPRTSRRAGFSRRKWRRSSRSRCWLLCRKSRLTSPIRLRQSGNPLSRGSSSKAGAVARRYADHCGRCRAQRNPVSIREPLSSLRRGGRQAGPGQRRGDPVRRSAQGARAGADRAGDR